MSQTFGIEAPGDPSGHGHQHERDRGSNAAPARFLILIDSASGARRVARVLAASHQTVAEFDASAPEVQQMTVGLTPRSGAAEAQWDTALSGHSDAEREAAEVYTLDA